MEYIRGEAVKQTGRYTVTLIRNRRGGNEVGCKLGNGVGKMYGSEMQ